jgi:hypothetical protein
MGIVPGLRPLVPITGLVLQGYNHLGGGKLNTKGLFHPAGQGTKDCAAVCLSAAVSASNTSDARFQQCQ